MLLQNGFNLCAIVKECNDFFLIYLKFDFLHSIEREHAYGFMKNDKSLLCTPESRQGVPLPYRTTNDSPRFKVRGSQPALDNVHRPPAQLRAKRRVEGLAEGACVDKAEGGANIGGNVVRNVAAVRRAMPYRGAADSGWRAF